MDLTPIFRIEKFLDAIVNSTTPPEPVFRGEFFLAKIAGADVATPEPIFRIEKYLAKIAGEDVEIPEPQFRIEFWLAKLCGMDVETPTPMFRVEFWLEEWSGGSSDPVITLTGKIISFLARAAKPFKSTSITIEPVQSGTGDPSPSNVRPISGWTGATVYDTGTNIWDEDWEVGNISTSNGNPYSDTTNIRSKNFSAILPGTQYYAKTPAQISIIYYDSSKNFVSVGYPNKAVITAPNNAAYFKIATRNNYGNTYNNDISINYPSTDHDYHAYSGTSVSLTFGQTVYGGTLTVNEDGSGQIEANMIAVDMGTLTYNRFQQDSIMLFSATLPERANADGLAISEIYKKSGASSWGAMLDNEFRLSATLVRIRADEYETTAALVSAITGNKLCYTISTPVTIPLTPGQIQTLVGVNNVWADTNGDLTVEVYGTPIT